MGKQLDSITAELNVFRRKSIIIGTRNIKILFILPIVFFIFQQRSIGQHRLPAFSLKISLILL